eukprot:TRINITY_DN7152_c0_g1_i2.p1 TRINITY_DN7152_c0_g1~~TRINITY_DN7152_c0_g1_i2.p1  ORF type:complete len:530 (+),score=113.39 TRINITY_DN7152_c0_g1_i2:107-1591(+)
MTEIQDVANLLVHKSVRGSLSSNPPTRVNRIVSLQGFTLVLERAGYPLRLVFRRGFRVVGFTPVVSPGADKTWEFEHGVKFRGHFLSRGEGNISHKILNVFMVGEDLKVHAQANVNLSQYVDENKSKNSIVRMELKGETTGKLTFNLGMIEDIDGGDENHQKEANDGAGIKDALVDDTVKESAAIEQMRQRIVVALMAQDIEMEEHKQTAAAKTGKPMMGKWKDVVSKVANQPEQKKEDKQSRLQDYVFDLLQEVSHLRKERNLMRRAIAAMFSRLRLLTEDNSQSGGAGFSEPFADTLQDFQDGGEFHELDMEDIIQLEDALGESRSKVMQLERDLEASKKSAEQAQASRQMLESILMETENENFEVRNKVEELAKTQEEWEEKKAVLEKKLAESGGVHEKARQALVKQIEDLRTALKDQMKKSYAAGVSFKIEDFQNVMGDLADEIQDIDERRQQEATNKKKKAGQFNALMSYWNVKREGVLHEDDSSDDEQ